jgi:signal transduction histidine kinase
VTVLLHLTPVRVGGPETAVDTAWFQLLSPVLAVSSGLPLAWRRRQPRAVAAFVLGSYAALAVLEGLVPPWAAWVLIWSLGTSGPDRRRSVRLCAAAAGATVAVMATAALFTRTSGALAVLVGTTVVVALVAVLVRTERGRLEETGRRAAMEERLRIARDMHDLVGHGLSAVAVQSSSARMAIQAGDPRAAERALAAVESSSRTAMREMRQMLEVLTDEAASGAPQGSASPRSPTGLPADAPAVTADTSVAAPRSAAPRSAAPRSAVPRSAAPTPTVADVQRLVDNVRSGGVEVQLEQTGDWREAPASVQLCAYRVVQEGLTNAVKHAPGSAVTVLLSANRQGGRVAVQTAGGTRIGRAADQAGDRGRGLEGLRARVTAASGEFWAGETPQGWLVEARLPLEREDAR